MIRNLHIKPLGLQDARPIKEVLTPALLTVTRAIVAGKTNGQIARDCGTTENVVKQYTHRIYEATGCASRLELATRYAFENAEELRGELLQRD